MLDSEKVAIAAHLHVLLRRITGRVTDTEWMAANAEYAGAMARVAHAAAVSEKRPELADWASRLEAAMGLRVTPSPAAAAAAPVQPAAAGPAPGPASVSGPSSIFAPSQNTAPGAGAARPPGDPDGPRYVGGLR